MIVLREVIGDELRTRRLGQGRTLRDVAAAACVSLGYLSEVERGRKEASSELLAAICAALGLQLSEILKSVSFHLADCEADREDARAGVGGPVDSERVPVRTGNVITL